MKYLYRCAQQAWFRHCLKAILLLIIVFLTKASYSQAPADVIACKEGQLKAGKGLVSVSTAGANLVDFSASIADEKVSLRWTTILEFNTSHFTIQRSIDGKQFDDYGLLFTDEESKDRNDYQFTDDISVVDSKMIYYRLKMVDMDSKSHYSEVVSVRKLNDRGQTRLAKRFNKANSELRLIIAFSNLKRASMGGRI